MNEPLDLLPKEFSRDNAKHGDGKRNPRLILAGIALVVLLAGIALAAILLWPVSRSQATGSTTAPGAGQHLIALALNNVALTSVFASQIGAQNGVLSNVQVTPMPNDNLALKLNLTINSNGIQRVMPVELDTRLGIDPHQNLQLTVLHIKRDGLDAGPGVAASVQNALNQLVLTVIMPALHNQLQNAKLVSVHTTSTLACGDGTEMLVLLIQAPPAQSVTAQPTPATLCFTKPINPNNLLAG